jgi:hypothetical protein
LPGQRNWMATFSSENVSSQANGDIRVWSLELLLPWAWSWLSCAGLELEAQYWWAVLNNGTNRIN